MYLQKSTCTVITKLPLTTDFLVIMVSAGEGGKAKYYKFKIRCVKNFNLSIL